MSTKPRTPAYFPRMKNRAAGRRIRKWRRSTVEMAHAVEEMRIACRVAESGFRSMVVALAKWRAGSDA